jgi:1-acyl-sn-glycerol-3-phosphate acyltransferase
VGRQEADRRAQAYARGRGLSGPLYSYGRLIGLVVLRLWFRVRIFGAERVPRNGPAIIAPNHKNFFDVFFVAAATRRRVHYMAKSELFKGPLGWLLLRMGAFPVRRGEADAEALETARAILADGGLVVMFPEGTRVEQPDALGSPHHGAGRLALQTGAPIIPTAITGTSHLWRGAVPKTKRVQLAFLPAIASEPALEGHETDRRAGLAGRRGGFRKPACHSGVDRRRPRSDRRRAARYALRRKPELLGTVEPGKVRDRWRKSRS